MYTTISIKPCSNALCRTTNKRISHSRYVQHQFRDGKYFTLANFFLQFSETSMKNATGAIGTTVCKADARIAYPCY